jgi:hypothetical protein
MTNRKEHSDHAETAVLPWHLRPDRVEALDGAATEAQVCYQEYLRSLEQVPVLVDVVSEPPRVVIKDFRLGQRSDARKAVRADAAVLREQHGLDLQRQYSEYVEICAGLATSPRKGARSVGFKKKRAKRGKRRARSKS